NRVTNYIYELDKGNRYSYEGDYEVFVEKRAEREELEARAEDKHQNTLRRERAWLKRGARARSTKQKARVERVHDMQEKKFDTQKQNANFQVGSTRSGKQVIELKGITKAFAGKKVISDFDY